MTSRPPGAGLVLALVMTALVSADARSEAQYPAGPVKIVVPFAPGGTTDVIARVLAQGLSGELGQQFYIENRGGAGGVLGADVVAKAPPDGQTALVYHVGLIYGPGLYKQLPYDVEKDFTPVTLVGVAMSSTAICRCKASRTSSRLREPGPESSITARPAWGARPISGSSSSR